MLAAALINFITSTYAYSLYPDATLLTGVSMEVQSSVADRVPFPGATRRDKSWTIIDGHDLLATGRIPVELQSTTRFLGDHQTLIVPMTVKPAAVTPPSPDRSDLALFKRQTTLDGWLRRPTSAYRASYERERQEAGDGSAECVVDEEPTVSAVPVIHLVTDSNSGGESSIVTGSGIPGTFIFSVNE